MATVIENLLAQPVQYTDPLGNLTKGLTGGVELGFNIAAKQYEMQRQQKLLQMEEEKNNNELLGKAFDILPKLKNVKGAERNFYLKYLTSLAAKAKFEIPPDLTELLLKSPETTDSLAASLEAARKASGNDQAMIVATMKDRMKLAGQDPASAKEIFDALTAQDKLSFEKYKVDAERIKEADKALNESGATAQFRDGLKSLPLEDRVAISFGYKGIKDKLNKLTTDVIRNPQKLELITTPEQKKQFDDLVKLVEIAQTESNNPTNIGKLGPLVEEIDASANTLFNEIAKAKEPKATPAQKAIDTKFSKDYQEFLSNGGFVREQGAVDTINEAIDTVKKDYFASGKFVGWIPDFMSTTQLSVKQNIEKAVQPLLRPTFGAQFTESEGKAFFARVFNDLLPQEENVKRLERLRDELQLSMEAKKSIIKYYEQNGTITGFPGLDKAMSLLDKTSFERRVISDKPVPPARKQAPAPTAPAATSAPSAAPSLTPAPAGAKGSIEQQAFEKLFGGIAAPSAEAPTKSSPKAAEKSQTEEDPFKGMSDEQFFEMLRRSQGE